MYNLEEKGFASFTAAYIAGSYNLPVSKFILINDWINGLSIDYVGCTKMMMIEGNSFRQRASGEHETSNMRTPYRLLALMLNRLFGRSDGKFDKIGWIPLMYHVTMEGTILN